MEVEKHRKYSTCSQDSNEEHLNNLKKGLALAQLTSDNKIKQDEKEAEKK